MKKVAIALSLALVPFCVYTQNPKFSKNKCAEGLEVQFLGESTAAQVYSEHDDLENTLNLIITDNRVYFNGNSFVDDKLLVAAIDNDSILPRTIHAVVGINNQARFEILSDVICILSELENKRISEVALYHFD